MGIALNAVYNNYMTAYAPKSLTRYDTHKKSELRNVYNSIVKINKESPWYLPITSKDTQNYAVRLKENARELHNTIAQLGGLEDNGLLDKKSAFSTNEEIASAVYIGASSSSSEIPELSLEVQSLASPQENLGFFLPDSSINLLPDTYSFDIGVNGMNYEFQFTIEEDETNRDVQERLMRLVNNADIGIKASMEESDGRSALRLVSESSGLLNGRSRLFTISDDNTSKSNGTVAYLGLDYTIKEASNALFSVNGEKASASSNRFTVDRLFDIQLKGVTPEGESVKIGLKTDVESLADNVTHLVGSYNDFIKADSSYLDFQTQSKKLVREMRGIANLYNNSLESMGVSVQEDGTLEVDKDQLRSTAYQSDDIFSTFGRIKDFSNALLSKSDQVSLNPMDYVDRVMVAYKNPGRNFANPYLTSAYSGMLFNGYC